jgi:hypothetical protein
MRLKTSVGGDVFGRYIRFGRGIGCPRYRERSCGAVRGRERYVWVRRGRLGRLSYRKLKLGIYLLVFIIDVQSLYSPIHF